MHTMNDISCLKTDLIEELKHELRCKGFHGVETMEIGQIVDMIKDLAQTEKDCMKACYYGAMVNEMYGEEPNDRMGYDNWRYSSGRFAPTGRGHYAGYTPRDGVPVYMNDRMGYPTSQTGTTKRANTDRMGYIPYDMMTGRHGQHYDDYRESKRYYTETKDPHEKEKMDHHAKEHVEEAVDTFKEIWEDADPDLKRDMKGKLSKLLAGMQV